MLQPQNKFWATTKPHAMTMPKILDSASAPEMEQNARNFIQCGAQNLVLDCERLERLTSVGLQSIAAIAKLMQNVDGKLCVINLLGQPREIFFACDYQDIVPVREEWEFETKITAAA